MRRATSFTTWPTRLNHAFSVYEAQIEWTDKDVSPDPSAVVDR